MTIGTVISQIAPFIAIAVPDNIFGSDEREHVELVATANEVAERIARAHEWQALKRLQTITGNGEADAWDLPEDFDRMPLTQRLWTSRTSAPLTQAANQDDWLGLQVRDLSSVPGGSWIMLAGQLAFNPILAAAETVQYYYLTNLIATDSDGVNKAAFTDNEDTFRLDERLLGYGIRWKWKQAKGLSFDVEFADFMSLLEQRIARDGAKGILRDGNARRVNAKVAYPWSLGQ